MPLLWHQIAEELVQNTNMIATPGKGILAADESTGTIGKRFDKIPWSLTFRLLNEMGLLAPVSRAWAGV